MERVAFAMKLLPGAEAEYRRRHAAVWPEMLDALRAAGARNYSIYMHDDDLFGVLDVDDFERFRTMMDQAPVNARWQADMAALIDASSRCSTSTENQTRGRSRAGKA
jgi:L-rhamnose mutarotase